MQNNLNAVVFNVTVANLPTQHNVYTSISAVNVVNSIKNHLMGSVIDAVEEVEDK